MLRIKPLKAKADHLWSLIIRKNNDGMCEICNREGMASHHVIGRKNLGLRYDLRNGVLLCYQCHVGGKQSAHEDPIGFISWFRRHRPKDFSYLVLKKNQIIKVNYEDEVERLKKLL